MATKLISTLSVEFLIRDHLSFFKCFPHIYELPVSYSERMLLWGAVVIFLRYILISKTEFLTWIIEIFYVNKQNLFKLYQKFDFFLYQIFDYIISRIIFSDNKKVIIDINKISIYWYKDFELEFFLYENYFFFKS